VLYTLYFVTIDLFRTGNWKTTTCMKLHGAKMTDDDYYDDDFGQFGQFCYRGEVGRTNDFVFHALCINSFIYLLTYLLTYSYMADRRTW